MAYAPGAAPTRTASRRPAANPAPSNGRPNARSKSSPAPAVSRRPSVTFLAGLGIGVALGAAAALLLAPRSGAETRQVLRNRGKRLRNRARSAWDDLQIELEATRRAVRRKHRDAKLEVAEELVD